MKMSLPMAVNIHMSQKKRIKKLMGDGEPDSTEMLMQHPHEDKNEDEMHQSIADSILAHRRSELKAKGGEAEAMSKHENRTFEYETDDEDLHPNSDDLSSDHGDSEDDSHDMEMSKSEADDEHEKMSMIDKIRMRRKMYR